MQYIIIDYNEGGYRVYHCSKDDHTNYDETLANELAPLTSPYYV
jgi:hypothetical protein